MQGDAFLSQKALSGGVSIASSNRSKNGSTSTVGSGRALSTAMATGAHQRERSLSQGQSVLNPPISIEDQRRISAQFPVTTTTPSLHVATGSHQRKRSRMMEENTFVREGISKKESGAKKVQIDAVMNQLHQQIEQVFSKGEKGKTVMNRLTILETFRNLGLEIFSLLTAVINLQEERTAAQQQVAQLQLQQNVSSTPTAAPYMKALLQAPNIVSGRSPPPPHIPTNLRHAPAERVLIFKAQDKGTPADKEQQKSFRQDVCNVIGQELMEEIEVIRPTRNGGHTLIFQSATAREEAISIFRANERQAEPPIEEEQSCIIAPKKQYAKVACRDPPDDVTPETVITDMYSKRNLQLSLIPFEFREARVIITKYGWIFEVSSIEAAAIQAQDGRIRFGYAREMRVEEYIPIQQCYNCCNFGHAAKFCRMETPCCRLCGMIGHAAWTCPHKDNKEEWKCANCITHNEIKGTTFPINHAAAQFHKCACAQQHKSTRKAQLIAAGIFTSPDKSMRYKDGGPIKSTVPVPTNGPHSNQSHRVRKQSRSRSIQHKAKNNDGTGLFITTQPFSSASPHVYASSSSSSTTSTTSSSSSSSSASSSSSQQQISIDMASYRTRMTKVQRPRSYDGWKQVRRQSDKGGRDEVRGRDFAYHVQGTNSTSQLQMVDIDGRGPISPHSPHYDE